MKKIAQKGFTLIELLVVIAIIGILATIVLTSLGSARTKASDAKIQSQLASLRGQGELYYNTSGGGGFSYGPALPVAATTTGSNGCNTTPSMFQASSANTVNGMANIVNNLYALVGSGNLYCYSGGNSWMVAARSSVTTTTYFCADSTGASRTYTGVGTVAGTVYSATTSLCM